MMTAAQIAKELNVKDPITINYLATEFLHERQFVTKLMKDPMPKLEFSKSQFEYSKMKHKE